MLYYNLHICTCNDVNAHIISKKIGENINNRHSGSEWLYSTAVTKKTGGTHICRP